MADAKSASAVSVAEADARERDHAGVTKIEALYLVFGKGWKLVTLYCSIGLIAYSLSLQNTTTYNYAAYATSAFSAHSLLGAITIATAVIGAVSKPFIAKIADLTSRPIAYVCMLVVFVLGAILLAASKDIHTYAAGQVLFTLGSTGIDFVTAILVADITSLQWRGLCQALQGSPYIVNAFVSGYITEDLGVTGWRWGYGLFAIVLPLAMAPALIILFWGDHKAKTLGALSLASSSYAQRQAMAGEQRRSMAQLLKDGFDATDAVGLILLGFGWSLVLLPFSLYAGAVGGWQNRSMIAMETLGWLFLLTFTVWELYYAKYPLMPRRILNRTFICCVAIDVLYYMSYQIVMTFHTSFVYVVTDWSLRNYTFWTNTLTVGLFVFAFVGGTLARYTHQFKYTQIAGVSILVVASGLYFHGTGNDATDAILVSAPVVSSLGGALTLMGSTIGSQASVPHHDLAMSLALLNLWSGVGGSIGNAIASAVWTSRMPVNLARHLAGLVDEETIVQIYSSIIYARDTQDAARIAVIEAYSETVKMPLYLPSLIIMAVALLPAFFTRDYYLGNTHNAVEDKVVRVRKDVNEAELAREAQQVNEQARAQVHRQLA